MEETLPVGISSLFPVVFGTIIVICILNLYNGISEARAIVYVFTFRTCWSPDEKELYSALDKTYSKAGKKENFMKTLH